MVRAQIGIRKGIRGGDKALVSLRDGDRTNADFASGTGAFRLGLILEHRPDQLAESRRIRMPMQNDCMAERRDARLAAASSRTRRARGDCF